MHRRDELHFAVAGQLACAVLALTLVTARAAAAAQIDVGVGTGCEAATIQGALGIAAFNGAATADEIRLTGAAAYTGVALEITDWDVNNEGGLTISGGWSSCVDSTASFDATLTGNGTDPVIAIDSTLEPISVITLRNLVLQGGDVGLLARGGGLVLVEGSSIRQNDGGVAIESGTEVALQASSEVRDNDGKAFGGGISCVGAGSSVTLYSGVVVSDNTATSAGGGIYAGTGCAVKFRAGAVVRANQASFGGGLYLAGGAWAENIGSGGADLTIAENEALIDGGGIYSAGAGPETLLGNARIEFNSAGERGGGVALIGGARLQIERFNFEACATPPVCAAISWNDALATGLGSAVYLEGGSEFRMHQGFMIGNVGVDAGDNGLIYAEDSATRVHLEGVQISSNRAGTIFHARDGAEVVGGFLTVVGNHFGESGGFTTWSFPTITVGGAEIWLHSSLLKDHQQFFGDVHGRCLRVDTGAGMSTNAEAMVGVDPMIVQDSAGVWRLQPGSPLVDSCDASAFAPSDSDFDLDARGFDHPFKGNVLGAYDRAADELRPIFADGFASGTTNAWSDSAP